MFENLLEGVKTGRLTATYDGAILSPEEYIELYTADCDCWDDVIYTVPS